LNIELERHVLGLPQVAACATQEVIMTKACVSRLVRLGRVSTLTKAIVLVLPNEPGEIYLGVPRP
jgi:hypothetical protein